MQTRLSPLFLCAFLLVGASASAQESADVAKLAADTSKESQSCIDCHRSGAAPLAVQQWAGSRHAQAGIGCYECHQADKERPDGFEHFGQRISVMVTPKSCGTCHAQEAQEFQASHHAQAGQILGSLDNVLGEDVEGPAAAAMGCAKCHGSVVKVIGNGKLDPATWPNEGIGRVNPDGSKGACSVCPAATPSRWPSLASRRAAATAIWALTTHRRKSTTRASMASPTARSLRK